MKRSELLPKARELAEALLGIARWGHFDAVLTKDGYAVCAPRRTAYRGELYRVPAILDFPGDWIDPRGDDLEWRAYLDSGPLKATIEGVERALRS